MASLAINENASAEAFRRPNFVIVYTDDQAAWALGTAVQRGWYNNVAAAYTPHIDRLASEGAIFKNFFCTTPVCSPARAALMTGRYASELGIEDFIPMPGHNLYDSENEVALDPETTTTFAEVFRQQGYKTGLVGKWHLGDWTRKGHAHFHPNNHGFDYFMGLTGGGTQPNNPELEEDGELQKFKGLTTDILTDRALWFIEQSQDKPFLLCLHTRAPHKSWLPVAPEDWEPYEAIDPLIPNPDYPDLNIGNMKRQMQEYLASCSGVDRNLGRILKRLDQLMLTDHTVVIFSSDHGYNMGHNGIWHKGNGIWATHSAPVGLHHGTRIISPRYRPNMYDSSLRVPMIMRWPEVIAPNTTIAETASSLDLFPTLVALADIAVPDDLPLQGRSLLPLLQGCHPADWDEDLYAEYHMINYIEADMKCYRTPKFKLIRDTRNMERDEFYDLVNDPQETENLINDTRPIIQSTIRDLDSKLNHRREMIHKKSVSSTPK